MYIFCRFDEVSAIRKPKIITFSITGSQIIFADFVLSTKTKQSTAYRKTINYTTSKTINYSKDPNKYMLSNSLVYIFHYLKLNPEAQLCLSGKMVIDMSDPNRPRFTLNELRQVLGERNELKTKLLEVEEELHRYRPLDEYAH